MFFQGTNRWTPNNISYFGKNEIPGLKTKEEHIALFLEFFLIEKYPQQNVHTSV